MDILLKRKESVPAQVSRTYTTVEDKQPDLEQSIFEFIDGVVQEWITSIEVKINSKFILNGIIILLSVSIMLKWNLF